jgi:putative transcriptional regulator
VHHFKVSQVTEARARTGLSQKKFATVLGVSPRTLQDWEQGRRKPSGAARSLLKIATKRPEVLREMFSD